METLVLTIDEIRDWLNCRRLYYYRHFCRLTNGNPKYSRLLEEAVKKSLYRWHMGQGLSFIFEDIIHYFDKQYFDNQKLSKQTPLGRDDRYIKWAVENEPIARQIIKAYADHYLPDRDRLLQSEPPDYERTRVLLETPTRDWMTPLESSGEVLVPIRNIESGRKSRGWWLKVKPDMLFEADGERGLMIWDIRSRFGDHYEKWLKLNLAIPYLMYALQEHNGLGLYQCGSKHTNSIRRVHVRMIRKQKPKKGEQFTERVFFNKRDGAFEEAIKELYAIALDVWTCSKEGDVELFYRNPENCRYYRCEYQELCFSGGDIGEMKKYKVIGDDDGRAI
ncbi:MAG: hypothetical protein JW885_02935 [Deltaproteobacteria bacterium]|nr:hypothetical protein [Candidatus Zymogenaceae bacterium]